VCSEELGAYDHGTSQGHNRKLGLCHYKVQKVGSGLSKKIAGALGKSAARRSSGHSAYFADVPRPDLRARIDNSKSNVKRTGHVARDKLASWTFTLAGTVLATVRCAG